LVIPSLNVRGLEIIDTPVVFGLTAAIISGAFTVSARKISPLEQLNWSWQRVKSRWMKELLIGVIFGLILGIILWLSSHDLNGLRFGLIAGHIYGLFFALGSGLGSSEIQQRIVPNQGIHSSFRNSWIVGLIGGLLFGVIFGLISSVLLHGELVVQIGLIGGVIFGLLFGLKYGGVAWTQHFILRQMLCQKGRMPWNYSEFLDIASERLLMKKVGGGYVFFHRMLLEHFAQRNQN
jgi:hypothetical protein